MTDREGLLRELDDARALLLASLDGLPEEDFRRPMDPGAWTPHDVLSHIAAWDEVATARVQDLIAGRQPDAVDDVDAWNAEAVAARRDRSLDDTLAALHAARETLRAALATAPSEVWADETQTDTRGKPVSLGGIVRGWAEHDAEHAAELRAFRDRRPGRGPQAP